jgi:RNA polymerase-binding transcription factor DksA
MSDRLLRALTRALDEDCAAEQERDSERRQAQWDQEHAQDAERRERELRALERIALALQQLGESVSRISVSGIQVHGCHR